MPSINPFASVYPDLSAPGVRMIAVTPVNDDLSHVCRMLYVGTGGTVVVRDLLSGSTITHVNVASGSYLGPFQIDRVTLATTATDIVGYV